MNRRNLTSWFAGCWLAIAAAAPVRAQAVDAFCEPGCEHEMQLFAPVDFDFDCQPIKRNCGWTFGYERFAWATTPERVVIGSGVADDGSLAPFRNFLSGFAGATGTPPNPLLLTPVSILPPAFFSGLESGPPRVSFAWGDRYELGYSDGQAGWKVGVLSGRPANDIRTYGTNTQDTLYGSVLVTFADPQNLMRGFIDVVGGAGGGGAFAPDGNADDIDGDGQFGPDGYDLDDPGRVPDNIFLPDERGDFDDIVRLPTSFQFLTVRNSTESDGIELMRTHQIDNSHMLKTEQNNSFEIGAGVRYMRIRDKFLVSGSGGVMGISSWDTRVDNNLVGPQIAANWTRQRHRMLYELGGRFMAAYNIQNFQQDVSLGQDMVPDQYNRPIYFPATVANQGKQENFFSPVAELRLQASYQITTAFSLKLGYTALFIDNISRSTSQVRYELPRMGFREDQAGKQELFLNGVNFGLEANF